MRKMSDETRISEFNELQFKMIRIHKLQDQINDLWINPLSPNLALGNYNYSLILSNLDSLYSEVHAKCDGDEKVKIEEYFEEVELLIENNPPHETNNHPTSKRSGLNYDNWKIIKRKLRKLNLYVRELLDSHGYSPDKDTEDWRGL